MLHTAEASDAFNRQAHVSKSKPAIHPPYTYSRFDIVFYLPSSSCFFLLIDHQTYNFFIINDGIDKHSSLLRSPNGQRQRVSAPQSQSPQAQPGRLRNRRTSLSLSLSADPEERTDAPSSAMDIDDLTKSMSALRFVPTSVAKKKLDGRSLARKQHE